MVKKSLALIVVLWLAVIVMMPKQELYYLLEQELAKNDIKISSEKIREGWFTLRIEEPSIYVKGIKVATVKEIELFTLLFYTRGSLEGLLLDRSLERFAPREIDQAVFIHSVLNPLNVMVGASGAFGETDGSVNLMEKQITMKFSELGKLGMLKSKLKKDGEGWLYETSF
jgi:hypothetical protein